MFANLKVIDQIRGVPVAGPEAPGWHGDGDGGGHEAGVAIASLPQRLVVQHAHAGRPLPPVVLRAAFRVKPALKTWKKKHSVG